MQLLKFIKRESGEPYLQLGVMVVISGVANGLLIAVVNHAVRSLVAGEDLTSYFLIYMVAFILFLYTQWYAFDYSIILVEESLHNFRKRLSQKIKLVELEYIEKVGIDNLYARLTQNDTFITQMVPQITAAAQMFTLLIFSLLYLAYISPLTFVILITTIVGGVIFFQAQTNLIKKSLEEAKRKEARYFRSIADMIHGFKEIKINHDKAGALLQNIDRVTHHAKTMKIEAGRKEARMAGFGRLFVYGLLPLLVFVIPSLSNERAADVFRVTAVMLFIIGPITILVNMIAIVNRLNFVLKELDNLEAEMDQAIRQDMLSGDGEEEYFQELIMKNVKFQYPGAGNEFAVGPISESIRRGEVLFIIGSNGSGKSTLLKLLTGLYYPQEGAIYLDNHPISANEYLSYRNLFSVVFTDFHLFEKLYASKLPETEMVRQWLKKMQLQHKVSYQDGAFTDTDLSTGQRKRLALIAALLEDKPLLVIDEFAADQDPQFRRYFYETLLPEIKASGKTIIAVTHDDHYFHVADRILKMEDGKLLPNSI